MRDRAILDHPAIKKIWTFYLVLDAFFALLGIGVIVISIIFKKAKMIYIGYILGAILILAAIGILFYVLVAMSESLYFENGVLEYRTFLSKKKANPHLHEIVFGTTYITHQGHFLVIDAYLKGKKDDDTLFTYNLYLGPTSQSLVPALKRMATLLGEANYPIRYRGTLEALARENGILEEKEEG